jgi:hypothetical protein
MKVKSSLPTKEFALQMAEYYHHHKCPLMMWDWLVVWGFYEMYVSYQ